MYLSEELLTRIKCPDKIKQYCIEVSMTFMSLVCFSLSGAWRQKFEVCCSSDYVYFQWYNNIHQVILKNYYGINVAFMSSWKMARQVQNISTSGVFHAADS